MSKEPVILVCPECFGPVPKNSIRGRPRRFCSPDCKNKKTSKKQAAKRKQAYADEVQKLYEAREIVDMQMLVLSDHLAQKSPHDAEDVLTVLNRILLIGYKLGAREASTQLGTLKKLLEADPQIEDVLTAGISLD